MCSGRLGTVLGSTLHFRAREQNPVYLLLLLQAAGWVLQRQLALSILWGEVLGTVGYPWASTLEVRGNSVSA